MSSHPVAARVLSWPAAGALGAAVLLAGLAACAPGQPLALTRGPAVPISVSGAWARAAALAGDGSSVNSAAYLVIAHQADVEDALVGARSPAATAVEVHRTVMEDGVMRMRPAGDVPVAARGTLTLEPGGLHLMLIGLRQDLREGATVPLVLEFRRAGAIAIDAAIRASAPAASTVGGGR